MSNNDTQHALNFWFNKATEQKKQIKALKKALEEINKEELNSQRPGGGYSKSASISYEALQLLKEEKQCD